MRRFRVGLGVGLLMACSSPEAVHAAQDERAFAAGMIQRIKQKAPDAKVTQLDDPLSITLAGGPWDGATINFHRIFGYCERATETDCVKSQTEFVDRTFTRAPEVTPGTLRIAVRDKQYVDYILNLPNDDSAKEPLVIARPIGEDLFAIMVADAPDKLSIVTPKQLRELKLAENAAWQMAWRQTRAKLPPLPTAKQLKASAVLYQDQEYLASLLADLDGWKSAAAAIGPDMFMTVVADNYVFIGAMPDGPGLETFKKSVNEDCAQQQRCVSPNLYRFRDGQWIVAR